MNSVYFRPVHSVLLCVLLASCGGSSSGSGDSAPENALNSEPPNILLVIADDQGLDASAQYSLSQSPPTTPITDQLAASGIVFNNAWATPSCTTTRGSIITGLHGIHSGVDTTPDLLDTGLLTLQKHLKSSTTASTYSSAVIGKWHLAGGNSGLVSHPLDAGVDYYAGTLEGTIDDYYNWPLTLNGVTEASTTYHTTKITDLAIDWVSEQSAPWFLWVAYVAPHAPFHLPPANLHSRPLSGDAQDIIDNPREYYLAAIEAMDTEIGRLIDSLAPEVRDNTLIIYLGDNGTPGQVIDTAVYPRAHRKGTLYEGGVRVPMVISGKGVSRLGEQESALVNTVDFFPTLAELAGHELPANLDGKSLVPILNQQNQTLRTYNYSEYVSADVSGWIVRDETLKLIGHADGSRELYDLTTNSREEINLIDNALYTADIARMEAFADSVRSSGSGGGDLPVGGGQDITNAILTNRSANCSDYAQSFSSRVLDVNNNTVFDGTLIISVADGVCSFTTNAIPNHDFNDGAQSFPNDVSAQVNTYTISATPTVASTPSPLSLAQDNALLLNGVKVDILAAACHGVADEKTGCTDPDQLWRFDPMHAANGFRVDSHNAHTQPDGTYHYHGTPNALYADSNLAESGVIGFAADGFPIYGSYFDDGNEIRKALPGYRLKSGTRPGDGENPGGNYDGTYRDDYEYVANLGDLDQCNGMTVNGQYAYYITDDFPYVLGCFTGTPDPSFVKQN